MAKASSSSSPPPAYDRDSQLLRAVRPLQWIFAIFVQMPPPPFNQSPSSSFNQSSSSFNQSSFNRSSFNQSTFNHSSSRPRPSARLLYTLYSLILLGLNVWMAYEINVVSTLYVRSVDLDSVTNVLSTTQTVALSIVQALTQLTTLLRHRQLCQFFVDFERLEHDIRWCSLLQRLGAPGASFGRGAGGDFRHQLHRKSGLLLLLLCVGVYCPVAALVPNTLPLPYRMLTAFFSLIVQVKGVEFCATVQLLHALLQQLLRELLFTRQQLLLLSESATTPKHLRRRQLLLAALQGNQQWLSRLWQLVNEVERYFALPMLVFFLYNGHTITHNVNWAYIERSLTPDEALFLNLMRLCFASVILVNMLVPCWLCQSCIRTYDQFSKVLHYLRSDNADPQLSLCLREYSLQLMHQKLLFSCGGFFDINLRHFGATVLTVTTYIVILIQFKLQGEAEKEQETKTKEEAVATKLFQ